MNNIDVAILHKVNKLAERYGVPPYEFTATYGYHDDEALMALTFHPDTASPETFAKFEQMMAALEHRNYQMLGDDQTIYDALADALKRAPKRHGRSR